MTPEQFRDARNTLGYSAERLARRLRVQSGRTIRRWEAGDRDIPGPAIAVLELLAWLEARGLEDPYPAD